MTGKRYKVLQLATQSGTAYRFAMPLAKYLRREGYEVMIGCSDEPQPDVPSYHDEIRAEGFELLIVPIARRVRPLQDLRAIWMLSRILRRERFDVVHSHNSKAGIVGRIAARLAGVRLVVHTNHGLPFFKADTFSFKSSCVFWLIEFLAARITNRILAVSPAEFEKAKRFRIACPPKLVEVGQGIRPGEYSRARADTMQRDSRVEAAAGWSEGRTVIGTICRLVPEKGIDLLLTAVGKCRDEHPDLAVLVVGDGPERERLERQAEELGIAAQVRFTGGVSEPEVVGQFYSIMDVFVLPTRWESFGIVFAEAMSMELPVIGPQMEPITTVVADGETGILVPPEDPDALAAAISKLLSDPSLRTRMGQAGRRRVIDVWDEERMLERIERVYREFL